MCAMFALSNQGNRNPPGRHTDPPPPMNGHAQAAAACCKMRASG